MKYTQTELRNPKHALLKRLERQLAKQREKEEQEAFDFFSFPSLSLAPTKTKQTRTKLWLFDRRGGR